MSIVAKTSCCFVLGVILHLFISLDCNYVDAIVLDDIDIDYVNSQYINISTLDVSVNHKKKSANTVNMKYELIKDFPDDVSVKCNVSTRAFGYEVPTGLRFKTKLCGTLEGQMVFDMFYAPVGVKDCPPKKGLYEGRDIEIDFTKVPFPLMSGARLTAFVGILGNDNPIVEFRIFVIT